MLAKLQLSDEHAKWFEDVRKIPCEIAAEMGVVSKGKYPAFEYRQNGVVSYLKVRLGDDHLNGKYRIEPTGASLCLWSEDCLSDPSDAPLIITEGEIDALSFLTAGATHVVSVPNGAILQKPGEGEINPSDDRGFSYLWAGGKLKPGLQHFRKIILATDEDHKGRILRDELAIRLGRPRCWFLTYPKGCKDANEVLLLGMERLRPALHVGAAAADRRHGQAQRRQEPVDARIGGQLRPTARAENRDPAV
jgi:twinkle protein